MASDPLKLLAELAQIQVMKAKLNKNNPEQKKTINNLAEQEKRIRAKMTRRKRVNNNNNNNNNNNENRYRTRTGKYRSIPEPTNFYNQSLRKFFYKPSLGFYIILGLTKSGEVIKKRVPGHFYYKYDRKLGRIIPFRRVTKNPYILKKKSSNNKRN
jgi:hypothetical protein